MCGSHLFCGLAGIALIGSVTLADAPRERADRAEIEQRRAQMREQQRQQLRQHGIRPGRAATPSTAPSIGGMPMASPGTGYTMPMVPTPTIIPDSGEKPPPHWVERRFNGMVYYLVPLAGN